MVCKDSSDSVMKIAVISLHIYSILHGRVMRRTLAPYVYPQLEKTKVQFLLTPIYLFHKHTAHEANGISK